MEDWLVDEKINQLIKTKDSSILQELNKNGIFVSFQLNGIRWKRGPFEETKVN